ncbi:conserved hypothetical protein [Ricinus communis]|uniref:Uncharacterized protein n=1 Tax=Ricinus communis TaxID=3988 RepID=B9SP46_RICCO|nr:conserved hypothetical protein [Ricinus communis]
METKLKIENTTQKQENENNQNKETPQNFAKLAKKSATLQMMNLKNPNSKTKKKENLLNSETQGNGEGRNGKMWKLMEREDLVELGVRRDQFVWILSKIGLRACLGVGESEGN